MHVFQVLLAFSLLSIATFAQDTAACKQKYWDFYKSFHDSTMKINGHWAKPPLQLLQDVYSHSQEIREIAAKYGLDPNVLAGAILAKGTLNPKSGYYFQREDMQDDVSQVVGKVLNVAFFFVDNDDARLKIVNSSSIEFIAKRIREAADKYSATGKGKFLTPDILISFASDELGYAGLKIKNFVPQPTEYGVWAFCNHDAVYAALVIRPHENFIPLGDDRNTSTAKNLDVTRGPVNANSPMALEAPPAKSNPGK